jgi:hypothetical protein
MWKSKRAASWEEVVTLVASWADWQGTQGFLVSLVVEVV